jgi:riboflavin kinase / FMN adenylyltransferase
MNVWNGIELIPADFPPVVASIGKCDGVHRGHQEILRRTVAEARSQRVSSLLISFDPHPTAILAPERMPRLLQTKRQKLDALADTGLSDLLFLAFTPELAALDGQAFFSEVLLRRLRLMSVYVGEGFRFGRDRSGDAALLERIGARAGFGVHHVPPVLVDGVPISSSAIRTAIVQGDVELADRMLGRPYAIRGEIVRGASRGRRIGFPTANLAVENEIVPRPGVYVTEAIVLAARHPSVTNVGVRPTFGSDGLAVESHLIGFDAEVYGEHAELRFLARLRDELRFASVAELQDQIGRDLAAATAYFDNRPLVRR